MYKKIALIQGGLGAERSVSLNTGKAFEKALGQLGYNYVVIDAKEDLPAKLIKEAPNMALIALHGKFGEDGTVQGICEYLKIPYSGSGVLASALAMHKVATKQILEENKVKTPPYFVVDTRKIKLANAKCALPFPVVVKPAREGSSVGVSICLTEQEFAEGLKSAAIYDNVILVEKFIEGPEITVAIFKGKALTPIEIVPHDHFYDFEHKYTKGKTDYILPARLQPDIMENCKAIAQSAFQILDLRTYARMDFRVDKKTHPLLMEVNTLPGCTETSLVPKAAAHDGIPFKDIVSELVGSATLDYAGLR